MSILNVNISCFKDYRTAGNPRTVNMLSWLKTSVYREQVEAIRAIGDKKERDKLKAGLPAITPSGTFSRRASEALIQHSGLIQFDVDFQDNRHVKNYDGLKGQLCNISNVAYCGLSVSGMGYWGLVPIKHPEQHKSHFRALHKAFRNFGLIIDTAPQNPASLRGYSFDPDAYFNHAATPFKLLAESEPAKFFKQTQNGNDTRSQVEALIQRIQSQRIDITANYDQWLRIGFALVEEFGESGRAYFHAVSQYHPEYSEHTADRQYNNCIRSKGQGVTIATLFHVCREYGIQAIPVSERDFSLETKKANFLHHMDINHGREKPLIKG